MKKQIIMIAIVIITLICGYTIGRQHTIRQAELIDVTTTGYFINYSGDVHEYDHDLTEDGVHLIFEDGIGYFVEVR